MGSGGAFCDVSVARFTDGFRENGVRKSTNCADRRGPACESRPAHKSLGPGPTRRSAISGDSVRGIRKSGILDPGRMSGREVYRIPAKRVLTSPSRVLQKVSGDNGARKLTNCADRRGPAFESRPAHTSPDFGPMRKSANPGDIAGGNRKSGSRDIVRTSWGGSIGFRRRVV